MRTFFPLVALPGLLVTLLVATPSPRGQSQSPAAPGDRRSPPALEAMADQVALDVERLRGWTFKRPVVKERVDSRAVRRYVEKELDTSLPPPRRRRLQAFLRTAGLIPPDCDLVASALKVLEQQVAGYYDPATATLYLVERPDPMPEFMERTVLAHELTHALDDQYVNLRSRLEADGSRTEDEGGVINSLDEGSATALMLQYITRETMAGRVNPRELAAYAAQELERAKTLADMPRYFNTLFGSYLIGAAFLAKGDLTGVLGATDDRGIGENFRTAWAAPPRSTEQVLHPEKYWDEKQRDEPVLVDDRSAEQWLADPGRHVVHRDTLGELLTALLTEPRGAPKDMARMMSAAAWTNAGAIGWGGDRFYLLASGATIDRAMTSLQDPKGVWVTAWDSTAERGEFIRALEQGYAAPGYSAQPSGTKVAVVFFGFQPIERDALMKRLAQFPLRFTQAGRPWTD